MSTTSLTKATERRIRESVVVDDAIVRYTLREGREKEQTGDGGNVQRKRE